MEGGSFSHERELREQWQKLHEERHLRDAEALAKALSLARGTIDVRTLLAAIGVAAAVAGIVVRLLNK